MSGKGHARRPGSTRIVLPALTGGCYRRGMASVTPLGLPQLLLALVVVTVWGTNFVVIEWALGDLPPLLFAGLRFLFAFLPLVLFVRRPAVPWHNLAGYGLLIGAGQFGVMYWAMQREITPGLASLVVQTQVFFTIGLSMLVARERLARFQWLALALGVLGIVVIAVNTDGSTTSLGRAAVLFAAASWAVANLVARAAGSVNTVAYVVWSSLFGAAALLAASLVLEGWGQMAGAVVSARPGTWLAVLWQSAGNTLFGYAAWAWLLARYPAATVSPIALLVPVFGMGSSAWLLGEPLPAWKLLAAALVVTGLALNTLWPRLREELRKRRRAALH